LADGFGGFGGRAAVTVAGNFGSGLRQRDGDGCSETAGGAGDEGYFVVKPEAVEDVGCGVSHVMANVRCRPELEQLLRICSRALPLRGACVDLGSGLSYGWGIGVRT